MSLRSEALDAVKEFGGQRAAAKALGIPRSTLRYRLKDPLAAPPDEITFPVFPDDDLSPEEIIEHASRTFERAAAARQAQKWFEIGMPSDQPIGIGFMGDPHLDNAGCNWPLFSRHQKVFRDTPGLYAVNGGDLRDNWVGRLMRLAAEQDMSKKRSQRLVHWLFHESGIKFLVHILGNHDAWNEGETIYKGMNTTAVPMLDWQAKFQVVFPGGKRARIWMAHDFPGNSIYNSLHGPQKAALWRDWAHVYACGHKHNWAMKQEENPDRGFVYWLLRARGYKFMDNYAENAGHAPQEFGATVAAIINPQAKDESSFVTCYADLEHAAEILTWMRSRK